jgi:hypothetical protein
MSDLVELARRYVSLSDQLESVRGEIAKAVLNGGGGNPEPHPTSAQRRGEKASQPSQKMVLAAEAEAKVVEVLPIVVGWSGQSIWVMRPVGGLPTRVGAKRAG